VRITTDNKLISEGHDPVAAMELRATGLLGRINRMLADAELAIVFVYGEGVSPTTSGPMEVRIEKVRKASAVTNEVIDLGIGVVASIPTAHPDVNTEWGVVGDDGMIPIPRGFVVLSKEEVAGEVLCILGQIGGQGKKYSVPDSDLSLVKFI